MRMKWFCPSRMFVLIVLSLGLVFYGCQKEPETPVANTQTPTLESLEDFFAQAETGSVKVSITDAQSRATDNDIIIGSVVKVSAVYPSSKPEGTYVFYVRPSTGGYKNAMIFKGIHGG